MPHLGLEHPAVEREGVEQNEGITLPEVPVRHRYAGSPVIHYRSPFTLQVCVSGPAVTFSCETIAATGW